MTNPNEELVNMMANTMDRKIPYWKCQAQAEVMLGVILSDISKVAMVCPECMGTGSLITKDGMDLESCSMCDGKRVVPRNEMKDKMERGRNES